MEQFARAMGYVSLVSGALMVAFPESARRVMKAREEFLKLSTPALRLLGGWQLLMGVLLVSATARPAVEARAGEVLAPEFRKAA